MTDGLRLPRPDEVRRWGLSLVEEVRHAPDTLRGARDVLGELARLPDQPDQLIAALDRTVESLDGSLVELSETIVGGMNDRVGHADDMVSDMRNTLTSLIGAIPVARRALQTSRRDIDVEHP